MINTTKATPSTPRLQSLDIFRGLIMLIMLFVNDLAGVKDVPPWMEHIRPSTADGMTFVDLVFPIFLFIVGVSIPFAIGNRLDRGVSPVTVWKHILTRTIGLLFIGFFMVNGETIAKNGPLSPELWSLLIFVAVPLIWLSFQTGAKGARIIPVLRVVGIAMLIAAALLYRGNDATGWFQLRPQWWGILGLIGWAYLGGCIVYMVVHRFCEEKLASVIGAIALIYCLSIADGVGGLRALALPFGLASYVSIGTVFGSQTGITVAGIALGMMIKTSASLPLSKRVGGIFFYGLALIIAGVLLHSANGLAGFFHYNKNDATIPWCLVSAGVGTWLWIVAYLVGDVRPIRLATALAPVGQNALFAYMLAPIIYSVMDVLRMAGIPHFYNMQGEHFATGFCRAVIFAVGVSWVASIMERRSIRLKL